MSQISSMISFAARQRRTDLARPGSRTPFPSPWLQKIKKRSALSYHNHWSSKILSFSQPRHPKRATNGHTFDTARGRTWGHGCHLAKATEGACAAWTGLVDGCIIMAKKSIVKYPYPAKIIPKLAWCFSFFVSKGFEVCGFAFRTLFTIYLW